MRNSHRAFVALTGFVHDHGSAANLGGGHEADFYAEGYGGGSLARLCYQVGSSVVGCASSGTDWFHLTVRPGAVQYFTVRVGGRVYARATYRHGRLVI